MSSPNIFYRINRKAFLFEFGESIGDTPILGEKLSLYQARLIKKMGGELREIDSMESLPSDVRAFWFDEDLYFSEGFLRKILKLKKEVSLNFCLARNSFNLRYALPDDDGFKNENDSLRPRFGYFHGDNSVPRDELVEQKIYKNPLKIPSSLIYGGIFSYDQTSVSIVRIFSPFHLLQANLAALFCATAPLRDKLPAWFNKRLIPYSRFFYFILRRQNKMGRNCRVHPTAVLEGVTLGDNVTIGANVVLRASSVGEGTLIEDGSIIKYCVLGKNNYICNGNQLVSCVTYDNVFLIHGPYQFSIFGRNAVAMAVLNCDVRLDRRTIVIPTPAGLLDSNQPLLGVAYGHDSKVGAGNTIAPGRIIPNGLHLNPPNIKLKFESVANQSEERP